MKPVESFALENIDLSQPIFWLLPLEQREGAFQLLRREKPISFHAEIEFAPLPRGPGYWALTKHRDVIEVSRNAGSFCSGKGSQIGDMPQEFNEFFGSMINMDDPDHGRLRRIVSRGFTPRQLARLEDYVQRAAKQTIDAVIEKGECDFVTEIAAPLPLRIICEMMGIPESQHGFVFDRTNQILGAGDPEYMDPGSDIIGGLLRAGGELSQLVQDLGKHRLKNPGDDLTSALVNTEIEGGHLNDAELGSFFVLLVVAGNETTRNAISHGMRALSNHPDQRDIWVEDFEGVADTAVEEIVRWATPVIHFRRTATRDTVLSGQKIREGEKVVLFYNSANRDEQVFENPYRFDVRRAPNEHVGFGGPGPHHCLGAHLARREIKVMFRELFRRMPDLEITGEPQRLASAFINGIKHMPCAWTPSA